MPWYYRKRKGNLNFSLSRRGPRVSLGLGGKGGGCLLPIALAAGIVAIATLRKSR